jgi:hypothetical protein
MNNKTVDEEFVNTLFDELLNKKESMNPIDFSSALDKLYEETKSIPFTSIVF